jgi:NADH-quinone oxidoreductase subunit H
MFFLNMAALGIWAERRQSAMIQDRPGPNRAVVYLPSMVARGLVFGPPALLAGLAALRAIGDFRPQAGVEWMVIALELMVFVAWFSLLVLYRVVRSGAPINGAEEALAGANPRAIFYTGLVAHLVVLFVVPSIPREAAPMGARVALGLLAALLLAVGGYSASRVSEGKVALRLAGTLHSLADALKLVFKEDFVPAKADKLLHSIAPIIALFPALVVFAVLPFGDRLCFGDNGDGVFGFADLPLLQRTMGPTFQCANHVVSLQIVDLNVGILFFFAMAGTGVIGAALAGWASDNKFSLLGGLRAASQMVSYEVAMGLSIVGLFMIYGSLRFQPMVEWQGMYAWGIFVQPFAFFLFLAALTCETKRVPFDQPEGESEIVAGYFVEYSGMKFGMFYMGEYIELFTSSALLVTLFFGGYALPFLHSDGITVAFGDSVLFQYKMTHASVAVLQALAFFGKTVVMSFVTIFYRWTLPRFRYDQVMRLGWTKLLPFAIANMLVTGVLVLAVDFAPVGFQNGLRIAGQVTQAIIALGSVAAVVALISLFLEPVHRKTFLNSTSARFAAAAGGTKATPQQA